jgi:hypothetical protein
MLPITRLKIEELRKKNGSTLLKEYGSLDADEEWLLACYQHALIEQYAKEIGYGNEIDSLEER